MPVTVGGYADLTWKDAPPGVAPSVTVTRPDGEASSPTVTDGVARYPAIFPGRHLVSWAAGEERFVDILDVWPEDPRYLISLDDALDAIRARLPQAQAAARDQLQVYVAAATWVVENITGPILVANQVRRSRYNGRAIVLPAPGQVTSVLVGGVLAADRAYEVDEDAGIVYLDAPAGAMVTVHYVVGSSTIPANVRLATREQVRFLWQVGNQGARSSGTATDTTPFIPEGFAVPRRVIELLQSTPREAGFA